MWPTNSIFFEFAKISLRNLNKTYSGGLLRSLSIHHKLQKTTKPRVENDDDDEDFEVKDSPPEFTDSLEEVRPINCNKSRLLPQHRNIIHGLRPYEEAQSWVHNTEKYQRHLFGKLGVASGIDPRICFPTKMELEDKAEYERVAYPHTLQQMIEIDRKEKEALWQKTAKRENEIAKKLEKLEQWKVDLNARLYKKNAEALAARERKERLVEEVRRHFGFKVDPKDERFKEMLEKKDKEDRKKQKEAKRKVKEEKMLVKLLAKEKQEQPKVDQE